MTGRIYQIDLFRFLAALSVVLFHYMFRGYAADNMSDLSFVELGGYFKYGYLGVDLFFIISGFVIPLSMSKKSLKHFFISRIARLYPIYWISVLITFVTVLILGAPRYYIGIKDFILNLTMFQNYMGIDYVDGVYWTLFIEMKFYIFVIALFIILNKFKEVKLDWLICTWLFLSLVNVFLPDFFMLRILDDLFFFYWSSYFIAGLIFYQISKNRLNYTYLGLLFLSGCLSVYHAISRIERMEASYNTEFSPFIIAGAIAVFYSLMLLVVCGKLDRLNYRFLTRFGVLTYPLYLIHQKVGFVIFNNLNGFVNKYVIVIATIGLMLIVSLLLSLYFESLASKYIKSRLYVFTEKLSNKR